MDFPFKQLTPKGQIKVDEGHMDSLFDLEKYEDFNEDNIMRDILCLSTIGTDFDFLSKFRRSFHHDDSRYLLSEVSRNKFRSNVMIF